MMTATSGEGEVAEADGAVVGGEAVEVLRAHSCREKRAMNGAPGFVEGVMAWPRWVSQPGVEVGGWEDAEGGVHAVVAEAAELGAEDGVVAGGGGGEVDVDGLAGDGVLLEAHLGDGEAVDDVLGAEGEVDFAVGGEDELAGDEVVVAVGVGGVEAEGIAFAGVDEREAWCGRRWRRGRGSGSTRRTACR